MIFLEAQYVGALRNEALQCIAFNFSSAPLSKAPTTSIVVKNRMRMTILWGGGGWGG